MRLDSDAKRVEQGSLFQKKATLDKTLGRDGGRGGGGWRKKHGKFECRGVGKSEEDSASQVVCGGGISLRSSTIVGFGRVDRHRKTGK